MCPVPGPVETLALTFVEETAVYNKDDNMYMLQANISWQPPLEPNGVITKYTYTLEESNNSMLLSSDTTNKTSVSVDVSVSPYTNYTVRVQGFTSIGPGNESVTTTLSLEAGEQAVYSLTVCRPFVCHLS